jgi:hypothetical protein
MRRIARKIPQCVQHSGKILVAFLRICTYHLFDSWSIAMFDDPNTSLLLKIVFLIMREVCISGWETFSHTNEIQTVR